MPNSKSLKSTFLRIWSHLSKHRKIQIILLLILMILASFAEVISISAVLPFLTALTEPSRIFNHNYFAQFKILLKWNSPNDILLPLTLVFSFAALTAGTLRLALLWVQTRLSFAVGAEMGMNIYKKTLYQEYSVHLNRNSSEVISGISNKANGVIFHALMPILTIISSVFSFVMIVTALIFISPIVTISSFLCFAFIYLIIIIITKPKLEYYSSEISRGSNLVIKLLQEGLGCIRDILLDGTQDFYSKSYNRAVQSHRRAQAQVFMLGAAPRFGLETLGTVTIAIFAYFLSTESQGVFDGIPLLGAIALGAQRLLPLMQQTYSGWVAIKGGEASLNDTLDLLDQKMPDYVNLSDRKKLNFTKKIVFSKVSFRYKKSDKWVIDDLCLEIEKGSKVGIIGQTGSGKSTTTDIIMGLLKPTKGCVQIDETILGNDNYHLWGMNIAHVPQNIFLFDATIAENIALGISYENIDFDRLDKALCQSKLKKTVESWSDGYNTIVGERGVRLSGGQRQRIGIARAIYKNSDVIIFDEATSALDDLTENEVMSSIESLRGDLTVIIVAHRLTTLKICSKIFDLERGKVKRVGTYEEIVLNG